ncbi:MAG: Na+/H+ antiporter subunit E [Candidatus Aminicenantes bacterium]|nr:Na+/H+ antiporter subunit E [Candidatus Aminicenantes bacterium]
MKRIFILNSVIQFILLFGLWLLLSGHYDPTHILMGLFSCLLVTLLNLRLRKYYYFKEELKDTEAKIKGIAPGRIRILRLFFYIPWLIWQIVISSLQVAYAVLRPKMPIDPALIRFKTKLPNLESKVILGNSITLTPGTITIRIEGDEFLVHALMDVSQTGILDGSLPTEVAKLYERTPEQVVQQVEIIKSSAEI